MSDLRRFGAGALIAIVLGTPGCSDSNGPDGSLDARVRFVHAVRETNGTVTASLDGGPSAQLVFKGSSAYESTPPGLRTTELTDDDGRVTGGDVSLSAGVRHTIAFIGPSTFLARGLVLFDEPGSPSAGNGLVRIVHGAIQRDSVDAYLVEPGGTVELPATVPDMEYLTVSSWVELPAGQLSLVLTKPAEPDSVEFVSDPFPVAAGTAWTVLLIQGESSPLAGDIVVLEDGTD